MNHTSERRLPGAAERAALVQLAQYAEWLPCSACPEESSCDVKAGGPGRCVINRWIAVARRLAGVPIGDLD